MGLGKRVNESLISDRNSGDSHEYKIEREKRYQPTESNIIVSESEINSSPFLVLTEELGNMLYDPKLVIIAGGLVDGPREERDGMVLFGKSLEVVVD